MNDAHYIDTRPIGSPFSPPAGIEDYAAWLQKRYKASRTRDGDVMFHFGIAQRINRIAYAARHEKAAVFAVGPHAAQAATAIEQLTGIRVDILG